MIELKKLLIWFFGYTAVYLLTFFESVVVLSGKFSKQFSEENIGYRCLVEIYIKKILGAKNPSYSGLLSGKIPIPDKGTGFH